MTLNFYGIRIRRHIRNLVGHGDLSWNKAGLKAAWQETLKYRIRLLTSKGSQAVHRERRKAQGAS